MYTLFTMSAYYCFVTCVTLLSVADCRGIVSPVCPAVNQIVDSLDEIQYLTELNDADISSVQSIFEDHCLHALLSVFFLPDLAAITGKSSYICFCVFDICSLLCNVWSGPDLRLLTLAAYLQLFLFFVQK